MKGTAGNKYVTNLFFSGLSCDVDPEMLDKQTGAVLEAHCMEISRIAKNKIQLLKGDKVFVPFEDLGDLVFTGGIWLNGYVIETWFDIITHDVFIYANGILVAQNPNLPGDSTHFLDFDSCDSTSELFITDNKICPIVLDLQDLLDSRLTTIYFEDYDKIKYEINRNIDLSFPVFQKLEDLGIGGGLKAGSYAYAMRFSTKTNEKTPWGPTTSYIPIPYKVKSYNASLSDAEKANSGILIAGQGSSLVSTKYGIRLRLRINNGAGFDYVELKRYSNVTGQSVNYTPIAEYLLLALDASGDVVDIRSNQNSIVDFVDNDSLAWAVLDESALNTYSTIKRARTIRYFDRRIVLGGVEYESHLLSDKDIFIQHSSVSKIAFPIIEQLDYDGYSNPFNQVFMRAHRLGEKYGFAAKLYDNQGNMLYTVPLIKDAEDFKNYQFPDRRDVIPSLEIPYSPDAQTISTVFSYDPDNIYKIGKVYEPIKSCVIQKNLATLRRNIVKKTVSGIKYDYHPVTPTGRDIGYARNGEDINGLGTEYMATAENGNYNTPRHGTRKFSTGLSIGGIDTTKLPSWVKSFSIVRTPAAGRVICQGIAMYALDFQSPGSNPSLKKYKDRIWFYSPEFDINIGNKSNLFNDIKTNPSNYKMQLISPVGFFTDVYSAYEGNGGAYGSTIKMDMISYAIMGGNDIHLMEAAGFDLGSQIGVGNGRVTFGRFRNCSFPGTGWLQGSGIDSTLTFTISLATEPVLNGWRDSNNRSRTPYLELSLGSELYAYTDIRNEPGTTTQSRKFHEPWYIVNIIKEGAEVPNNNVNSYNDIGHHIKLESLIGIGNGETNQELELVDERYEDVETVSTTVTGYRYIWVDGKPWLGTNNIAIGTLNTYKTSLESTGKFTPIGGLECFGLYLATETIIPITGVIYRNITFPYTTLPMANPIYPEVGKEIKVRYNKHAPIRLFLGDTIVDDTVFAPIDCNIDWNDGANQLSEAVGVRLSAPMPYYNFIMSPDSYYQPRDPKSGSTIPIVFEMAGGGYPHQMEYIRQWLVSFGCESSMNLSFLYKDYFPNRNFVMRPAVFDIKTEIETIDDYLDDMYIYSQYNIDYPDEYLKWGYGGFHIPGGNNLDYEKKLHTKGFTEPASGVNELIVLMKRIHWSTQGLVGYPASKSFIPTNIYDLKNDKASQISILYDVYSDKGGNLYVITDRGCGILLTNKRMITEGLGNSLEIQVGDSSLIQGEIWLNASLGCPREFWRGKSEGNVKLPNNAKIPILIFPSYGDIVMLSANSFLELADNNRENITNSLVIIDLSRDFITKLYSVIDEGENNIWMVIGDKTYLFNIDINNWCAHVVGLKYVKSLYAPYLEGVDDRNVLTHILGGENILSVTTTPGPTTTPESVTTGIPTTFIPTTTTTTTTTTSAPVTTPEPLLDHIDTIAEGTEGDPMAVSFEATMFGNEIIKVYWQIRNSAHNVVTDGYEDILMSIGTHTYNFSEMTYPPHGIDHDLQIGLDGDIWDCTSNHFTILMA